MSALALPRIGAGEGSGPRSTRRGLSARVQTGLGLQSAVLRLPPERGMLVNDVRRCASGVSESSRLEKTIMWLWAEPSCYTADHNNPAP